MHSIYLLFRYLLVRIFTLQTFQSHHAVRWSFHRRKHAAKKISDWHVTSSVESQLAVGIWPLVLTWVDSERAGSTLWTCRTRFSKSPQDIKLLPVGNFWIMQSRWWCPVTPQINSSYCPNVLKLEKTLGIGLRIAPSLKNIEMNYVYSA